MHIRRRRSSPALVAIAAATLACSAVPAPASEKTSVEPVRFALASAGGGAGHAVPALLDVPPGWMPGDAAVVVVSDKSWSGPARGRLVAALLDEGAAVLELDPDAARGSGPAENARPGPPPSVSELAVGLGGLVGTLKQDVAAGLVVVLGHGAGGDAALLAAAAARAESGGDRPAAGASLGPGPAAFALGGVPSGGEMGTHRGWPVRAARLCGVLAAAVTPPDAHAAEGECRRALVEPREGRGVRVAGP